MSTIIGLVVYGSNFDVNSVWRFDWLYLFPIIVLPALHKWINPFLVRTLRLNGRPKWPHMILAMGAIVGILAYQPMHFHYWDEHSSSQAMTVSLLGVFSYLASIYGANRVAQWQGKHLTAGVAALLIVSLIWLCALIFPMLPLLGVSLIMAIAMLWPVETVEKKPPNKGAVYFSRTIFSVYLLFLLMLDLSLVVWDFQVNTQWAAYIASAFFMAALGYYIFSKYAMFNNRIWIVSLVFVVIVNMVAGVIWPVWLLQLSHAAIDGLVMGVLCCHLFVPHSADNPAHGMLVASAAIIWGMVFGYLFYANLVYVQWRLVLLLPFGLFLIRLNNRQLNQKTNSSHFRQ